MAEGGNPHRFQRNASEGKFEPETAADYLSHQVLKHHFKRISAQRPTISQLVRHILDSLEQAEMGEVVATQVNRLLLFLNLPQHPTPPLSREIGYRFLAEFMGNEQVIFSTRQSPITLRVSYAEGEQFAFKVLLQFLQDSGLKEDANWQMQLRSVVNSVVQNHSTKQFIILGLIPFICLRHSELVEVRNFFAEIVHQKGEHSNFHCMETEEEKTPTVEIAKRLLVLMFATEQGWIFGAPRTKEPVMGLHLDAVAKAVIHNERLRRLLYRLLFVVYPHDSIARQMQGLHRHPAV